MTLHDANRGVALPLFYKDPVLLRFEALLDLNAQRVNERKVLA